MQLPNFARAIYKIRKVVVCLLTLMAIAPAHAGWNDFTGWFYPDDGLVTKVSQLSTNHLEPSEGSLAALLDGNFDTFFHSTWSESNPDGNYAYLQVDLGVSLREVAFTYAKRNASYTGHPTKVRILATNNPNGSWTDEGIHDFTYTYSSTVNGQVTENYSGGILVKMNNAYRYVRLQVEGTEGGGNNLGNLYFYWSEFRAFNPAEDEEIKKGIGALIINELQVANIDMFMGPTYNYDGWVELYNPTAESITLRNCWVSDDPDNLLQCKLAWSRNIPAGGFGVVWFGKHEDNPAWQAQYKLDCDGGTLYISDGDGQLLLSVDYPEAIPRASWARKGDGSDEWGYTDNPTPGSTNAPSTFATEMTEAPVCDIPSQIFTGQLRMKVTIPSGCTLRYTTDGSTPTATNGSVSRDGVFNINNTTAIYRLRLFRDGMIPGPVVTRSFICTDRQYTVPVVSVVTDDRHLYDNTIGVMVRGTNGVTGRGQNSPCNWNRDWDRPVNFEYILPDGSVVLDREATLLICGGWSRANTPHSFKIKGSKVYYGLKDLDYDFFSAKPGLKHHTAQFRSGGNDNGCRIIDASLQTIIQSSGIDIDGLSYQPVVHYLNGVYNGVINLREPNNKDFVYANRGWDDDEIDQFEIGTGRYNQVCGTHEALIALRNLCKDCADDAVYDEVCEKLDIDEFCNYMATEIYLGPGDWLNNNNNCKGYCLRGEGGKFRLVQFDLDSSFSTVDAFGYFSGTKTILDHSTGKYDEFDLINMFIYLCRNARFRKKFADTFCLVVGSVFEPSRCKAIVDSLVANVSPMMAFEGRSPSSSANNVKNNLSSSRQNTMIQRMRSYSNLKLSSSTLQKVSLEADRPQMQLYVDDMPVPTNRFNGQLVAPITLRADIPAGYRFTGWRTRTEDKTHSLLASGSKWRYYDSGSLDSKPWSSASYDDSAWKSGTSPLGYASKDLGIRTNISYGTSSSNKNPTAYFRTTVDVPAATNIRSITLHFRCDDGFILYVNGREATRYNMPDGKVSYNTYTPTYSSDYFEEDITLSPSLFHEGVNSIAVEVHNCSGTSTDLFWDATLAAVLPDDSPSSLLCETPEYELPTIGNFSLIATCEPITDAAPSSVEARPVRINELSATNSIYVDEYFSRSDWVELVNTTSRTIDVAGMYLSDDPSDPHLWRIPSTNDKTGPSTRIEPYGHLIIWCDKQEAITQLHSGFKLSSDGGTLTLTAADDTWADTLTWSHHEGNHSIGLSPDAGSQVVEFTRPTPWRTNKMTSYSTPLYTIETAIPWIREDEVKVITGILYDLQGRPVLYPQRGSIYIQDGKKIIWGKDE